MPSSAVAEWQLRMRTALFEAVSENDVREIVHKLVEAAKRGDLAATRLLLSYVMGGTSVNVKQAVIVAEHGGALAPLPKAPTRALPGTPAKLTVMTERAAAGLPVCDNRDEIARRTAQDGPNPKRRMA